MTAVYSADGQSPFKAECPNRRPQLYQKFGTSRHCTANVVRAISGLVVQREPALRRLNPPNYTLPDMSGVLMICAR